MAELKAKEGELTDADLAAYGIPPKQPDEVEGEVNEQGPKAANNPDVEASSEEAGKLAKVKGLSISEKENQ